MTNKFQDELRAVLMSRGEAISNIRWALKHDNDKALATAQQELDKVDDTLEALIARCVDMRALEKACSYMSAAIGKREHLPLTGELPFKPQYWVEQAGKIKNET